MGGAGIDGDEQVGAIENLCEVDERSFAAKILDGRTNRFNDFVGVLSIIGGADNKKCRVILRAEGLNDYRETVFGISFKLESALDAKSNLQSSRGQTFKQSIDIGATLIGDPSEHRLSVAVDPEELPHDGLISLSLECPIEIMIDRDDIGEESSNAAFFIIENFIGADTGRYAGKECQQRCS